MAPHRRRRGLLVLLLVALVVAAVAIAVVVVRGAGVFAPQPTPTTSSAASALDRLEALPERDGWSDIRYDRDLFGQRWADVDRNGCDTRNDILLRDLIDPVFKAGTGECKVLGGLLIDPYDGSAVDFVSGQDTSVLVQIDHVVALGWAWHRGADSWTTEQRTAFANDPRNLVAATQETNQQKSAFGPGEWLPPEPELRCTYVVAFITVLDAYGLGIDQADRAASEDVLRTC